MFERYTEDTRQILFFSRYEATQLGSLAINTEHLLLGIVRHGKGLCARCVASFHVPADDLRKEVFRSAERRERVTAAEIPFSAEVKRALQFAAEEADRLIDESIRPEHLLLGLLRDERYLAASILASRGITLEGARAYLSAQPLPPTDEQQLRDIQQGLARAWVQCDRSFIESVVAPEWTAVRPDGQLMTRASWMAALDAVKFDSVVVDDVTVSLFGYTAVVRGRTTTAMTVNGSGTSARIRFTDVFLKRGGQWQAVASHASPLVQ